VSQGSGSSPNSPLYYKSQPTTHHMEDTLWSEIADAPGEIFDIPEMRELDEEYQNDEATWNAFLNSHWDF